MLLSKFLEFMSRHNDVFTLLNIKWNCLECGFESVEEYERELLAWQTCCIKTGNTLINLLTNSQRVDSVFIQKPSLVSNSFCHLKNLFLTTGFINIVYEASIYSPHIMTIVQDPDTSIVYLIQSFGGVYTFNVKEFSSFEVLLSLLAVLFDGGDEDNTFEVKASVWKRLVGLTVDYELYKSNLKYKYKEDLIEFDFYHYQQPSINKIKETLLQGLKYQQSLSHQEFARRIVETLEDLSKMD